MNFKFSSIVLALAAVASASPAKRAPATCELVATPVTAVPTGIVLTTEFNYVIGRSVSIVNGPGVSGINSVVTDLGNGSFHVETEVEGTGLTAAQTETIILGFLNQNLGGFAVASWHIDSVTC